MLRLDEKKRDLLPNQQTALKQRMDLLESFLEKKSYPQSAPRFAPGQLTIVDLSDPFIDPASACGYFEIVTRLFVRAQVDTGKVLVVDEAHKVTYVLHSRGLNSSSDVELYCSTSALVAALLVSPRSSSLWCASSATRR